MEKHKSIYKEPLFDSPSQRVELPQTYKIISCPNCATEVPADNLSMVDKIGKCGSCQAVFSIEKDILSLQQNKQKVNQEILRPEGIEVFEFKNELEISFEQPMTVFEWIMFIVVTISFMAGVVSSLELNNVFLFLGFSVVPTLLSIVYYLRRRSHHRKFIAVDDDYLTITWRPKVFNKNKQYAINDISQLYVKRNPNMGDWQVMMIIDEGYGHKHIRLSSLKTVSKAKYLEQVLESHLNIQDVVVPEET